MIWCGNLIIATFILTWCDKIKGVVIGCFMVVMLSENWKHEGKFFE